MEEIIKTTLSSDIVRFLRKKRKMKLKEIGALMNLSEAYISRVKNGQRNLRSDHLNMLEQRLNFPLPLLILLAREESIPPQLFLSYRILRALFSKEIEKLNLKI